MKYKSQLEAKNFDKDWAKKAGKDKFIKQHQHLAEKSELEEMYDKIVPPKTDKK